MCPRPRFYKMAPDKRAAILAAAAEEFARNGYEGASYNQVIEACGLSKGAMYYYFDDKDDLFATVLMDVADKMGRAIGLFGAPEPGEAYWGFMDRLARKSLEYFRAQPQTARIMWSLSRAGLTAAPGSVVAKLVEQNREGVRAMLRQGQALGAVRTDLPLDQLVDLASAVSEVNGRWFLAQAEDYAEADVEAMMAGKIGLLRRLLVPDPCADVSRPARKPAGGRR